MEFAIGLGIFLVVGFVCFLIYLYVQKEPSDDHYNGSRQNNNSYQTKDDSDCSVLRHAINPSNGKYEIVIEGKFYSPEYLAQYSYDTMYKPSLNLFINMNKLYGFRTPEGASEKYDAVVLQYLTRVFRSSSSPNLSDHQANTMFLIFFYYSYELDKQFPELSPDKVINALDNSKLKMESFSLNSYHKPDLIADMEDEIRNYYPYLTII